MSIENKYQQAQPPASNNEAKHGQVLTGQVQLRSQQVCQSISSLNKLKQEQVQKKSRQDMSQHAQIRRSNKKGIGDLTMTSDIRFYYQHQVKVGSRHAKSHHGLTTVRRTKQVMLMPCQVPRTGY